MRVLVVYESMFGNTRDLAEAIASGAGDAAVTECVEVSEAGQPYDGLDLLIVGGPTHQFGLSRPGSRAGALDDADGPLVSQEFGIREWIKSLRKVKCASAAAFDTSIRSPNLPGSAARGAAKRLRKRGYEIVASPEIFHVEGMTGPITDGELERARDWGRQLTAS